MDPELWLWYCCTMHIILWFNNIIIFFSISTVYHIIFVNLQHYYKYLCACQLDSWKPLTQICDDLCLSGIWICVSQYPQVFPQINPQVLTGLGYSCPPLASWADSGSVNGHFNSNGTCMIITILGRVPMQSNGPLPPSLYNKRVRDNKKKLKKNFLLRLLQLLSRRMSSGIGAMIFHLKTLWKGVAIKYVVS